MKKVMSIDMGGTEVKWGLITENGDILEKDKFKTPDTFEEMKSKVLEVINRFEKLSGLTFSCPGAVNSETGYIGGVSAIPYIHGPNIKETFKNITNLEVTIENDANCAALAEVWKGEASENEDVVFIVIGTGIGGAIIKDKKLHKGKNLHAGEFGIMYFETETGKPALWGGNSIGQLILKASRKLERKVTGIELFQLEESGNEVAKEIVSEWYKNLAKGILTIQYVYDPEKFVIGGAVSTRTELEERITKELKDLMKVLPEATILPTVKTCKFNNDANLIGAGYNFFQSN